MLSLSVALAFLFGYGLSSLPLLRAGMALSAAVPVVLAAGVLTVPVNRWLIGRGKGHARVHETHGGPSPRIVGLLAVVASAVLVAEAVDTDRPASTHEVMAP